MELPYIGAHNICVGWTLILEVLLLGMVLWCACACKYVSVSIALVHVRRRRVTMTTLIDGGRRERGLSVRVKMTCIETTEREKVRVQHDHCYN